MTVQIQGMRAQQVQLIYRQAMGNQFMSPAACAMVCFALWQVGNQQVLLAWLTVVLVLGVLRQGLSMAYVEADPTVEDAGVWENRFLFSMAAVSLVWGVGGCIALVSLGDAYQALVYFFLVAMAGGTAAIYAAHSRAVAIAISLYMGPSTIYFLAQGTTFHWTMAIGGFMFVVACSRAVQMINDSIGQSYGLAVELQRVARFDDLSGLLNRRAYTEELLSSLARGVATRRPHSLLMLDVDRFKEINDSAGHNAGDDVIRHLGHLLTEEIQADGFIGRVGGEEFSILLPDRTADEAGRIAEGILERIRKSSVLSRNDEIHYTASIGVAETGEAAATPDELMFRADRALYQAKREGRDRVIVHGSGRTPPSQKTLLRVVS